MASTQKLIKQGQDWWAWFKKNEYKRPKPRLKTTHENKGEELLIKRSY